MLDMKLLLSSAFKHNADSRHSANTNNEPERSHVICPYVLILYEPVDQASLNADRTAHKPFHKNTFHFYS